MNGKDMAQCLLKEWRSQNKRINSKTTELSERRQQTEAAAPISFANGEGVVSPGSKAGGRESYSSTDGGT